VGLRLSGASRQAEYLRSLRIALYRRPCWFRVFFQVHSQSTVYVFAPAGRCRGLSDSSESGK